ncbi:MAG: fatty acid desaturase [Pseudomonadota bacterium]
MTTRDTTRDDPHGLDDRTSLRHLGRHAAAILVPALYVWLGLPFWGVMLIPLGIALASLAKVQHWCSHQTAFKTSWLNDLVGQFTGLILFQPYRWSRLDHFEHHRQRNRGQRTMLDELPETEGELVLYLSGLSTWRDKLNTLFENAGGLEESEFIRQENFRTLRREAQLMLLFYVYAAAFTIFVWSVLFWVWLAPLVIGVAFVRLFDLAVSRGMFENAQNGPVLRIVRFLFWNDMYRAEHYAMPNVPFQRLPDTRGETPPVVEQAPALA